MNFNIRIQHLADTVVLSYDKTKMESINPEIAADLLHILKEKHLSRDMFFEFNPAKFADDFFNRQCKEQFRNLHSAEFNSFRNQTIKSLILNPNSDDEDIYNILESLYKYENVISKVVENNTPIQFRSSNFEVSFKDLSFTQELSAPFAKDFPGYLLEYLNLDYAKKNQKPLPAERLFSLSSETRGYLYDNYYEKTQDYTEPFLPLNFYLKAHLAETCHSANDIFNSLKIIDAISQDLSQELASKTSKTNKPKM